LILKHLPQVILYSDSIGSKIAFYTEGRPVYRKSYCSSVNMSCKCKGITEAVLIFKMIFQEIM